MRVNSPGGGASAAEGTGGRGGVFTGSNPLGEGALWLPADWNMRVNSPGPELPEAGAAGGVCDGAAAIEGAADALPESEAGITPAVPALPLALGEDSNPRRNIAVALRSSGFFGFSLPSFVCSIEIRKISPFFYQSSLRAYTRFGAA